jgi:hypothetical protein
MNPRTLCACQPVASISSALVAPPFFLSRARTVSLLLPGRAAGFSALASGFVAFGAPAFFAFAAALFVSATFFVVFIVVRSFLWWLAAGLYMDIHHSEAT